jgi:DMSO/TMAO reductase YedYZ molybdopterin-dependent catalytic subunit
MIHRDRRRFLQSSLAAGGALLAPPASWAFAGLDRGATQTQIPWPGAQRVGDLDFNGVGRVTFDRPRSRGLDGRLTTDLRRVTAEEPLLPNDRFFIRTRTPAGIDWSKPWTIRVHGLVEREVELRLDDLMDEVEEMGEIVLECSGNSGGGFGLLSCATWGGVPFRRVLERVRPLPSATRVLFNGFDEHDRESRNSTMGCSWILTLDQIERYGTFLATRMNGEPLPDDHGRPVRMLTPRWWGCSCPKWLDRIEFVDDSAPATSQMIEFRSRTHQIGRPRMAKDFIAPAMDTAAMPVRVEHWRVGGRPRYRIVGVIWGGEKPTRELTIRFNDDEPIPVTDCPGRKDVNTWAIWTHDWTPTAPGRHAIRLHVSDPSIVTRRLDSGFYRRTVEVEEV